MSDPPRRLVVGIGNPDRGDDGAGRLVARLLRGRLAADVRIEACLGGAAELIELLREADVAVLADAMVSGAEPGTIRRFDCAAGGVVPGPGGASSHGLGVAQAVGLARALGCLPAVCVVFAVEGADFAPGAPVSPPVAAAAEEAARRIAAELAGKLR
nr:hydrogenase maturation protease [uncultured Rhodopila sp.]